MKSVWCFYNNINLYCRYFSSNCASWLWITSYYDCAASQRLNTETQVEIHNDTAVQKQRTVDTLQHSWMLSSCHTVSLIMWLNVFSIGFFTNALFSCLFKQKINVIRGFHQKWICYMAADTESGNCHPSYVLVTGSLLYVTAGSWGLQGGRAIWLAGGGLTLNAEYWWWGWPRKRAIKGEERGKERGWFACLHAHIFMISKALWVSRGSKKDDG